MNRREKGDAMRKVAVIAFAISLLCLGATSTVFALGFRTPDQDARATGQAEAFTAQADDASAIYYNPAGLTQVEGTHFSFGGFLWMPSYRFDGVAGSEEMNTPAFLPHLFGVSDFGMKKWRFGIGINNSFGTSVDWGDSSSLRFLVTEARLNVINIAPTVAYEINEHLSVGAGLNVYRGEAKLKRRVQFAPLPEGEFEFKGDGIALGTTVGLLWKINEQHAVGVTYRSPFSIDFKGDAQVRNKSPLVPLDLGPSDTSAVIEFPQIVIVGYAFRPVKNLKLEMDVEWTNWDTLNEVKFRSSNSNFDSQIPFNWKDSLSCKFGVEYNLTEKWAIRGGYAFWENTVPGNTFSPLVPDSNLHSFTTGIGYTTVHWGVDLAYQYNLWETRKISGSVNSPFVDGNWDDQSHGIMLTGRLMF